MTALLYRSGLRYLRRHPWLLVLSVLGVALGVAVVVAIDLANASAARAFALSAETVAGRATHAVVGPTGGVPDSLYRRIRIDARVEEAAPVVEGYARYDSLRAFQVLGVDPLAEAPFRPFAGRGALDLGVFFATPGAALLSAETAAALGLDAGDRFDVAVDGRAATLVVAGTLTPRDESDARAVENLLVVDVSTAQELFARPGQLSRIDLLAADDAEGERLLARVRAVLPPGYAVERAAARSETLAQMTRAFEINLRALSLLALVVGMFLIYNTMTFAVVQRRPLLGRLRALGVTRGEVFRLVLGEAAAVGAVGTALGLALGVLLGRGLVLLVSQTINDLYYVVDIQRLAVEPWGLAKGALLGLGATLAAAAFPAREAATAPPNTVMQRSATEATLVRRLPLLAGGAVLFAGAGAGLLQLSDSILASYAALFLILMASALATPGIVVLASRLFRPVLGGLFGVLGRMAASGLTAALSRTGVAIAALTIAVAATVGVGIMVTSFRATVVTWLDYSLQADVYIQPPEMVARGGDATIAPDVARRIVETPGVAAAYTIRRRTVRTDRGASNLVAVSVGAQTRRTFRLAEGDTASVWRALRAGDALLVSEPYAFRHGLGLADSLTLATDRGPHTLPIRGVYYDYASDQGVVLVGRAGYDRLYDDDGVSGIALYAADGVEASALVDRVEARTAGVQTLFARSNRDLRARSLEVFDRTFTITHVLRLLAIIVAFIGVLSALMALQLERARELAVLRATGLTPREVGALVGMQTTLMGVIAGVLALPLGYVLAWVLIFVINKRSFGWTLQLDVSPAILLQALALAVVAAVLAGLYPARKMAAADPSLAMREAA